MDKKYRYISYSIISMLLTACSMNGGENIGQAEEYMSQGDYRSATIVLKSILEKHPGDRGSSVLLSKIYLSLGDGAAAEKELRKARQPGALDGSEDGRLVELYAQAYLLQGDTDRVLSLTDKNTLSAIDSPAIHALRGEAYRVKGELIQAQASFDRAVAIDSQSLQGRMGQVKILLAQNKHRAALSRVQQLLDSHPGNAEAWSLQGTVQSQMQQFSAAEKSYHNSLELFDEKQLTRAGFNTRLALIQSQLALGNMDDALLNVSALQQDRPRHPLVRYLRAIIAYQQQDYQLANDMLIQVLTVVQDHTPSYLLQAASQFAMGHYEQSREQLLHVINVVPSHIQARKMLAAVHLKLGKPKAAYDVLLDTAGQHGDDAELLAMVGRVAIFSGDIKEGIRLYKKAIESESGPSPIREELARLYLKQGAYGSAINELKKIDGKGQHQAKKLTIYAHIKEQDYVQAMVIAEQLKSDAPTDPAVPVIMGAIELNRGMRAKARQFFLDARGMDSDFIPAILNLARMALEDGSFVVAEGSYDEVLHLDAGNLLALFGMAQLAERRGDAIQAKVWVEKAAAANPKALEPVMILANHYIHSRQYPQAMQIITEAKRYQTDRPELMNLEVKLMLAQGKRDAAAAHLERMVALRPEETHYIQLAKVYEQDNRLAAAKKTLLKAQKQLGPSLSLAVVLSQIEIRLGDYESARVYIGQLMQDQAGKALAYGLSGDIYMQQENYKAAGEAYLKGAQLNKGYNFVAKQVIAQIKAGRKVAAMATIQARMLGRSPGIKEGMTFALLYMQMEARTEAIELYQQVLTQQPNNAIALNNLAWLYDEKGDARAFSTAEQAYQLAPRSAGVLDTYGWLLFRRGDTDRAVARLREAVKYAPHNVAINMHIVEALARQKGGEAEARERFDRLIAASPDIKRREGVARISAMLGR